MKKILLGILLLWSVTAVAEGYQEPLYRVWLVGASFTVGPTLHEPGPRLGQQLAAIMGNHGLTIRGDAGASSADLYREGKYLLDKYGHDPADFLVIDLTGSVFYERPVLLADIKKLIRLYRTHPVAKSKTTILVNEYPPLAGGNWFIFDNLPPEQEYNLFRIMFNLMVITNGAQTVPAWEHWRTNDYPHPKLDNMPDYHPTGGASKRAAVTILNRIETIWACKIQDSTGESISKSNMCKIY